MQLSVSKHYIQYILLKYIISIISTLFKSMLKFFFRSAINQKRIKKLNRANSDFRSTRESSTSCDDMSAVLYWFTACAFLSDRR